MLKSKNAGLLILLSAPSGAGKTTLCEQTLAANPGFSRAITCTTRAPREGEKDGVDYHFLGAETFLKRVEAGHFIEHATVYDHSYGTLKSEVLDKLRQGRDVLLSVDVQGAAAIQAEAARDTELKSALVTVFLAPASIAMLEERLQRRGKDSPAVIQKRLGVARQEIAQWRNYDYLIISSSIADDLRRMQTVINAERMRVLRAAPPVMD
jgi:guanylate kinase